MMQQMAPQQMTFMSYDNMMENVKKQMETANFGGNQDQQKVQ